MQETETLKFKKSTSELKEAMISMVAIQNKHKKGKLIFGVKPNGDVIGQTVTEKTLRDVAKSISDHIEPKIYPEVRKEKIENNEYIVVHFTCNDGPYSAYERYYQLIGHNIRHNIGHKDDSISDPVNDPINDTVNDTVNDHIKGN